MSPNPSSSNNPENDLQVTMEVRQNAAVTADSDETCLALDSPMFGIRRMNKLGPKVEAFLRLRAAVCHESPLLDFSCRRLKSGR